MTVFPAMLATATAPPQVEGAEAEQPQYARARAAFSVALVGQPVGNRSLSGRLNRRANLDARSPQVFVTHPVLRQALEGGVDESGIAPHLPGRQATAGWDGENDAASPHAGSL